MRHEHGLRYNHEEAQSHGSTTPQHPRGSFEDGTFIPKKSDSRRNVLIGLAVFVVLLAIAAALFYVFIISKQVDVTVDGIEYSVRVDTTVGELLEDEELHGESGDLLSITGEVVTAGGGEAPVVSVNGTPEPDHSKRIITGGERITITDGDDVTEDKEVVEVEVPNVATKDNAWGALSYVKQFGLNGRQMVERGVSSGVEIPLGIAEEPTPTIITMHTPRPKNNEKLVALTFDDGPSKYTPQILDVLEEHGAKATFFTLGQHIDYQKDIVRRAVEEGNQVASHSYGHKNFAEVDDETMFDDLRRGYAAVEEITGEKSRVFRAPYGVFKEAEWIRTNGEVGVLVGWTIDTNDWRRPGVDAIIKETTSQVQPGSIILMHDGGGNREQTVEALEQIVIQLKARGYRFVTINEMIEADGTIPMERTQVPEQPEPLQDIKRTAAETPAEAS